MTKKILSIMLMLMLAGMSSSTYAADSTKDSWLINVQHADIQAFVSQVADMTGKNFVLDPRVRAKDITVISRKELTSDEVYQLFLSVLQVNGYSAVPSGDSIKIVPSTTAKSYNLPVVGGRSANGQGLVTEVLALDNMSATEMVPVLRPLIPQYGHLAAVASANALVVSDHQDNIRRIAAIIARLENQNSSGFEVITLKHAWVGDVVAQLEDLIPDSGGKSRRSSKREQNAVVVADERTNRLLVRGRDDTLMQIEQIVRQLDVESIQQGDIRVFRLDHGDATAIAELLTNFFDNNKRTKKSNSNNPDSEVIIEADEALNALVVRADLRKMKQAKNLIKQLDTRRNQVLIEAVIVEVSVSKLNELGVQLALADAENGIGGTNFSGSGLSSNDIIAALVGSGSATSSPQLGDGITVGAGQVGSGNRVQWAGFIQALASNSSVNLLSTPSVLTLDNQEASILVGQNVPFVTGSYTNTSNSASNPFQTIQREDVGIKLKVTPHMGYGDSLRLELNQEVSSVVPGSNSQSGLTTNKREIDTTILAQSGETIVLGGLIQDDIKRSVSKVPLLGDIPLIGALFRQKSDTHERSNLIVFLRPTIMGENSKLADLSRDKYLDVVSLQFRIGKDGKLEQVEKQPLPMDLDDVFKGRAPASKQLKQAVQEREQKQEQEQQRAPTRANTKRSSEDKPRANVRQRSRQSSNRSVEPAPPARSKDSKVVQPTPSKSYSDKIVTQLEDWPTITEDVDDGSSDSSPSGSDPLSEWDFNNWPSIQNSNVGSNSYGSDTDTSTDANNQVDNASPAPSYQSTSAQPNYFAQGDNAAIPADSTPSDDDAASDSSSNSSYNDDWAEPSETNNTTQPYKAAEQNYTPQDLPKRVSQPEQNLTGQPASQRISPERVNSVGSYDVNGVYHNKDWVTSSETNNERFNNTPATPATEPQTQPEPQPTPEPAPVPELKQQPSAPQNSVNNTSSDNNDVFSFAPSSSAQPQPKAKPVSSETAPPPAPKHRDRSEKVGDDGLILFEAQPVN